MDWQVDVVIEVWTSTTVNVSEESTMIVELRAGDVGKAVVSD